MENCHNEIIFQIDVTLQLLCSSLDVVMVHLQSSLVMSCPLVINSVTIVIRKNRLYKSVNSFDRISVQLPILNDSRGKPALSRFRQNWILIYMEADEEELKR